MSCSVCPLITKLPPIESLPALPASEQLRVLDLLFEPSPALHALVQPTLSSATFSSYPALVSDIRERLLTVPMGSDTLLAILGAHPRLGAARVESAQSLAEQARLISTDPDETSEALARLNAEYEVKYPGLRYVVFVNGRARAEIIQDMRRRIDGGDMVAEQRSAIEAMCSIADDRAAKLVRTD